MEINQVSGVTINAAMKVHSALGPGLLESAYEACLIYELRKDGFDVKSQLPLPVLYDGVKIDAGYRIDLLVEDVVIVELKTVERLLPVHQAQLLSSQAQWQARWLAYQLSCCPSERRNKTLGELT